jgi:hypothetical protein
MCSKRSQATAIVRGIVHERTRVLREFANTESGVGMVDGLPLQTMRLHVEENQIR